MRSLNLKQKYFFIIFIIFSIAFINFLDLYFKKDREKKLKEIANVYQDKNHKNIVFPIILSIRGTSLNEYEKILIREINPYGIILMKYNIKSKEQLKNLRKEIESIIERQIIFFVDQEGGRVNRLSHIYPDKKYPAPYSFNKTANQNLTEAKKMVYNNALNIANDLKYLEIDVNLGLVLDTISNRESLADKNAISSKKTKFDIGDRSFSNNPEIVNILSKEYIKAFNNVGVKICAKHFIGLGASVVNTHRELAIIDKSIEQLKKEDLLPFYNLYNVEYGMLAHAIYSAIDSENPAPFSKKVINFIREELNFKGLLISDAIHMGALNKYTLKEKIEGILNSGVDLVLVMNTPKNDKQLKFMLQNIIEVKNNLSVLK